MTDHKVWAKVEVGVGFVYHQSIITLFVGQFFVYTQNHWRQLNENDMVKFNHDTGVVEHWRQKLS